MANTGSCQESSGLLQALADGGLAAAERASVEAHLSACPVCSREAARLKDNAAFLAEALAPFRMPGDFRADFLFRLPKRDSRHRAAPTEPAGPRTVVMGDTRPRRMSPWVWVAAAAFAAAAGGLGWLFLGPRGEITRHERSRPGPDVKGRRPPGEGEADARPLPKGTEGGPGSVPAPAGTAPGATGFRSVADLLATLRGVRGEAFGPVVKRGWDLIAGTPAEGAAVRAEAAREKDPRIRAALVLCLGATADEDDRQALRSFLADEAPEVRAAAVLGLARALSIENPSKRVVPSGPPLGLGVELGSMIEDPGRAELLARLGTEPEAAVRRVILLAAAPTAGEPGVRERFVDGLRGNYGDDLREVCLKSLHGIQDPALVPVLAEAYAAQGTPKALHAEILEAMIAADRAAAAEAIAGLIPGAEASETRRELVVACAKAGGAPAEKALHQVLGGDPDPLVRLAALQVLARFPSKETLEAVQRAENDPDGAVQQEAEKIARALRAAVEKQEGQPQQDQPPEPRPEPPPPPPEGGGEVR